MKLLYCPRCEDVIKLTQNVRYCECKKSSGKYLFDGLNAEVYGEAVPLGFANSSFTSALRERPKSGDGRRFEAFVIPLNCGTVKHGPFGN